MKAKFHIINIIIFLIVVGGCFAPVFLFLDRANWHHVMLSSVAALLSLLVFMGMNFFIHTNRMHTLAYKRGETTKKQPVIVSRKHKNQTESLLFFCEYTDGQWVVTAGEATWELTLEEYAFPQSYIRAFIARQILYLEDERGQNIFHTSFAGFRHNLKSVYFACRGVKNIRLQFRRGKYKREVWILKNGKMHISCFSALINNIAFYRYGRHHGFNGPYYLPRVHKYYDEDSFYNEVQHALR